LDTWSKLLTACAESDHYHRHDVGPRLPLMTGDTLRVDWALNLPFAGTPERMELSVTTMQYIVVSALVLYIHESVAYLGIEREGDSEQYFTRLPDVWQLYGIEDDDTLSLSERRAEEVLVML
jgi:hypothetical protein